MSKTYRKTATVTARKVEADGESVRVYSLEGPAVAKPGDYIVTANTGEGESWVIAGRIFEATYEEVPAPRPELQQELATDLADALKVEAATSAVIVEWLMGRLQDAGWHA